MTRFRTRQIQRLIARISPVIFGRRFIVSLNRDKKYHRGGRLYIQLIYFTECTKTRKASIWKGRKWYLSQYMTDDEVVKTVYAAFEMAVKHEVLEGFKVDGKPLFNPHVNFEALLKISHKEVRRK